MIGIGRNIRAARIAAGYGAKRQGEFAALIGVAQSRLSDWENDRGGLPDVRSLMKVAKGAKVSLDMLVYGVDPDYDRIVGNRERSATQLSSGASEGISLRTDPDSSSHPGEREQARSAQQSATVQTSVLVLPAAVIDRLAAIETTLMAIGDLRVLIDNLKDVSDAVTERAAAWAAAAIDQQRATARVINKARGAGVTGERQRPDGRKTRG